MSRVCHAPWQSQGSLYSSLSEHLSREPAAAAAAAVPSRSPGKCSAAEMAEGQRGESEAQRYGPEVVGRRVSIRWTHKNSAKWYNGVVMGYEYSTTSGHQKHIVQYDDGDKDSHTLHEEELNWLPPTERSLPTERRSSVGGGAVMPSAAAEDGEERVQGQEKEEVGKGKAKKNAKRRRPMPGQSRPTRRPASNRGIEVSPSASDEEEEAKAVAVAGARAARESDWSHEEAANRAGSALPVQLNGTRLAVRSEPKTEPKTNGAAVESEAEDAIAALKGHIVACGGAPSLLAGWTSTTEVRKEGATAGASTGTSSYSE